MNIVVISEVDQFESKLTGYSHLLNFKYMNLCVKATPVSLLPVTVLVDGEPKEIEDVAEVAQTDEFHLAVIPKAKGTVMDINQGILSVHPEFKLNVAQLDDDDPGSQFLSYEMPEVDKDRRDFLDKAVKSLYDECKARMDELKAEELEVFADIFSSHPEDLKEASDAIDEAYDKGIADIRELLDKKRDEIEEAYLKYQGNHPEGGQIFDNNGSDTDITQGMTMASYDE